MPAIRSIAGLACVLGSCLCDLASAGQPGANWFSTWAAPPALQYPDTEFGGLTTREIMHVTLPGSEVRLRISNLYGNVPLVIGAAHLAVPTGPDTIDSGTDTALSFGGSASVAIPVGAVAVSDPVSFAIAANTNYAVSIYTPVTTGPATAHYYSSHDSYAAAGDQVSNTTLNNDFNLGFSVFFVSGLDVYGTSSMSGIVAIGDSITDGYGSTFETDTSWPDFLAMRLANLAGNTWSVANTGIAGNALLVNYSGQNALARFDRDVLALPGTKLVIEAEGINDIGGGGTNIHPTAEELIGGLRQMINRAHENGLLIYGATITPAGGSSYFNPVFEQKRQNVNAFIRSGSFDGLMDFDAVLRDPSNPTRLLAEFDSGDHLHPNTNGYAVMASKYPSGQKARNNR